MTLERWIADQNLIARSSGWGRQDKDTLSQQDLSLCPKHFIYLWKHGFLESSKDYQSHMCLTTNSGRSFVVSHQQVVAAQLVHSYWHSSNFCTVPDVWMCMCQKWSVLRGSGSHPCQLDRDYRLSLDPWHKLKSGFPRTFPAGPCLPN